MTEHEATLAGQIVAHAYADEMDKLASKGKIIGAGLGGLALGAIGGGAAGYKLEQARVSPKERKLLRSAMLQAYKQGNMDMFKKLRAMAQGRSARS